MKSNCYPIFVIVMSLSILSFESFSQNDSLKKDGRRIHGTKFILSFDSRQSFVLGRLTKMNGLKIGIEFNDRYRFGFGFYKLDEPIKLSPIESLDDTILIDFEFWYSTIYAEYVLYQDYRWEVSVPLSVGSGTAMIKASSQASQQVDTTAVANDIPIVTLSIAGYYKVFHWVGIGAGLGYRRVLVNDEKVKEALSSPFYVIKLKIFLGGLYQSVFKHKEVVEEREEYKRQREEKRENRKHKKKLVSYQT